MDDNVIKACKKAIILCNYMLNKQDDVFVQGEKKKLEFYVLNAYDEDIAGDHALKVSRYIKNNFDNVIGLNVQMDIEQLLDR